MDLGGLRVDSFQCRNHADREGVGICVACRSLVNLSFRCLRISSRPVKKRLRL